MIQQDQDISKMSVIELKTLAYDLIAVGENNQRNLQVVNNRIGQLLKEELEVKPEVPKE